jgi:kynureninase
VQTKSGREQGHDGGAPRVLLARNRARGRPRELLLLAQSSPKPNCSPGDFTLSAPWLGANPGVNQVFSVVAFEMGHPNAVVGISQRQTARGMSARAIRRSGQCSGRIGDFAAAAASVSEGCAAMKTAFPPASIATLDRCDPLRSKRDAFSLRDGIIYLDGNSLGPPPKAALRELKIAAEQEWREGLIGSWNAAGWFDLAATLGDRIASLIGAAPGETVVTDTTSINIYKAIHAGLNLRPGRSVIVAEAAGFPTDIYMTEGVASVCSDVRVRLEGIDAPSIEELLSDDVAVVLVNHVDYRTGVLRDMAALTRRIHAAGAIAIWDLCHSAGVLKVDLNANGADFAVGCTYKYLNGGPGSPAFVFAARRHHSKLSQPLKGWWGHASPFAFDRSFRPGDGIRRMLCGTQPILSMRALAGALEVWNDVDLDQLREKSLGLTDLFIALVEEGCGSFGITLAAPRERTLRGSQVSLRHPHAYEIMQALIDRGVIGDFRSPDYMRFGFAPLYLNFADVYAAGKILEDILANDSWRASRFAIRGTVT